MNESRRNRGFLASRTDGPPIIKGGKSSHASTPVRSSHPNRDEFTIFLNILIRRSYHKIVSAKFPATNPRMWHRHSDHPHLRGPTRADWNPRHHPRPAPKLGPKSGSPRWGPPTTAPQDAVRDALRKRRDLAGFGPQKIQGEVFEVQTLHGYP